MERAYVPKRRGATTIGATLPSQLTTFFSKMDSNNQHCENLQRRLNEKIPASYLVIAQHHIALPPMPMLWRSFSKKSCPTGYGSKQLLLGISGKMQILYAMAFTTRYLDLFLVYINIYDTGIKVFYIGISIFTLYLIYVRYRKTFEWEYDKFWIEAIIILCLGLGLLENPDISSPEKVLWAVSYYLEGLVLVPQMYFNYKSECISPVVTLYVLLLAAYRGCYACAWIESWVENGEWNHYSDDAGLLQFFMFCLYFILGFAVPKKAAPPVLEVLPYTPRPELMKQQSLLETPFLKRTATVSSIYTISRDGSANSSPCGSVTDLKSEGRY